MNKFFLQENENFNGFASYEDYSNAKWLEILRAERLEMLNTPQDDLLEEDTEAFMSHLLNLQQEEERKRMLKEQEEIDKAEKVEFVYSETSLDAMLDALNDINSLDLSPKLLGGGKDHGLSDKQRQNPIIQEALAFEQYVENNLDNGLINPVQELSNLLSTISAKFHLTSKVVDIEGVSMNKGFMQFDYFKKVYISDMHIAFDKTQLKIKCAEFLLPIIKKDLKILERYENMICPIRDYDYKGAFKKYYDSIGEEMPLVSFSEQNSGEQKIFIASTVIDGQGVVGIGFTKKTAEKELFRILHVQKRIDYTLFNPMVSLKSLCQDYNICSLTTEKIKIEGGYQVKIMLDNLPFLSPPFLNLKAAEDAMARMILSILLYDVLTLELQVFEQQFEDIIKFSLLQPYVFYGGLWLDLRDLSWVQQVSGKRSMLLEAIRKKRYEKEEQPLVFSRIGVDFFEVRPSVEVLERDKSNMLSDSLTLVLDTGQCNNQRELEGSFLNSVIVPSEFNNNNI